MSSCRVDGLASTHLAEMTVGEFVRCADAGVHAWEQHGFRSSPASSSCAPAGLGRATLQSSPYIKDWHLPAQAPQYQVQTSPAMHILAQQSQRCTMRPCSVIDVTNDAADAATQSTPAISQLQRICQHHNSSKCRRTPARRSSGTIGSTRTICSSATCCPGRTSSAAPLHLMQPWACLSLPLRLTLSTKVAAHSRQTIALHTSGSRGRAPCCMRTCCAHTAGLPTPRARNGAPCLHFDDGHRSVPEQVKLLVLQPVSPGSWRAMRVAQQVIVC